MYNEEYVLKKASDKNITLKIIQDFDPLNPRTEWDNFGKMWCWHSRYDLGDKKELHLDGSGIDVRKILEDEFNAVVILPLYLYDHSGITISTTPFICQWDSGQVGYIFATREDIQREWGVKRISKKLKDKIKDILVGEVKAYDQYLTGDVWGFVLTETIKCDSCGNEEEETIDSCFGFYGDNPEDTIKDYVPEKYQYLIDKLE
jgi:hypothetical protein